MEILFYIGIGLVFLSFIPWIRLATWIQSERRKYADMPVKLQEVTAEFKRRRAYLGVFQLAAIGLAIVGLLL